MGERLIPRRLYLARRGSTSPTLSIVLLFSGTEKWRGALPTHEQDLAGFGEEVQDERPRFPAHGKHQRLSGDYILGTIISGWMDG